MPKDRPNESSISMRAPSPLMLNFPKRQKSGLPFVSWEEGGLHREEEERIDAIAYPTDPPDGDPGLPDDDEVQEKANEANLRSLLMRGVPEVFSLKPGYVVDRCRPPVAQVHARAHQGLTRSFYSLSVTDDRKLFELCGMNFLCEPSDLLHLVEPGLCDLRYSQGGDGLVGRDPRLVSWRTWRIFESGEGDIQAHDLLMDLRSFAWYSLQHAMPHEHLILGGSCLARDRQRLVYVSQRLARQGWMVDVLPPGHEDFSRFAVAFIS